VRSYDAYLVDLDGTLYRARAVKLAMAAELALCGWTALNTLRRFRREHERLRETQFQAVDSPYRLQLERTAAELELPVELVEQRVQEWMIHRPGKWLRVFRRASLLRELHTFKQRGGSLALVSDYPAVRKLEALGQRALFDVVVANGEAGGPRWLKPNPEGLLEAARQLGAQAERCLVLGDRADVDGEAARRAGMVFRRVR
jgi:HAD superfamily hydrolase (TIGR01549 family)